jgi:hypothetical protein
LFAFRLAKDLGRTLDEILDMNITEFTAWAAFYRIEQAEIKKQMEQR